MCVPVSNARFISQNFLYKIKKKKKRKTLIVFDFDNYKQGSIVLQTVRSKVEKKKKKKREWKIYKRERGRTRGTYIHHSASKQQSILCELDFERYCMHLRALGNLQSYDINRGVMPHLGKSSKGLNFFDNVKFISISIIVQEPHILNRQRTCVY